MACNGEIYNYKELIKEHDLKPKTHSDCEVILLLYVKYGFEKMINLINGEFAINVIDIKKDKKNLVLYLARDQCGIRPMFFGETKESIAWCSEVKGLTAFMNTDNAL